MAIDDVYGLQLHYMYSGQQCMNTLYFRMKTATDPTAVTTDVIANDFKTQFIAQMSLSATFTKWVLQQVRGGTVSYTTKQCVRSGGRRIEQSISLPAVGSVSGDGLPPQCAMVTTLVTGFAGRSKRGRLYLGGMPESSQLLGVWGAAIVTSAQTGWNTQVGQYGVAGTDPQWELGVWSHTLASGCKPNPNPPYGMIYTGIRDEAGAFTPVEQATVRSTVYSQRRRTIGVGR